MARFTTLYSGSSGNAGVIEENGRFLLVDMGCSCRATVKELEAVGLSAEGLAGILVTHEHSDHIKGLKVFLKKYPVPLYAGIGTLDALWQMDAVPEATEMIAVNERTEDIEGFLVTGFNTSHDAAGSCGFRVVTPGGRIATFATDLGIVTEDVYRHMEDAHLVALEANYDRESLRTGPYPAYLKQRIAGKRGHLSNDASASIVAALISGGCNRIALCHLSQENNHPNLVEKAVESALRRNGVQPPQDCVVQISKRFCASDWMDF